MWVHFGPFTSTTRTLSTISLTSASQHLTLLFPPALPSLPLCAYDTSSAHSKLISLSHVNNRSHLSTKALYLDLRDRISDSTHVTSV